MVSGKEAGMWGNPRALVSLWAEAISAFFPPVQGVLQGHGGKKGEEGLESLAHWRRAVWAHAGLW